MVGMNDRSLAGHGAATRYKQKAAASASTCNASFGGKHEKQNARMTTRQLWQRGISSIAKENKRNSDAAWRSASKQHQKMGRSSARKARKAAAASSIMA